MKLKVITVAALLVSACTSNDEQPETAAQEPVAAESAELTDPAKAEAAPADAAAEAKPDDAKTEEPQPEAAPKQEEVTTEKSVSPGAEPAPAPAASSEQSEGLYVAVSHLNVRSGPGMAHPVVDVINFNSQHASLGIENRIWVKIGEGRYASRKYMTEQKLSEPMPVSVSQPEMSEPQQEAVPAQEEQAPAQEQQEEAPQEPAPEAEGSQTGG